MKIVKGTGMFVEIPEYTIGTREAMSLEASMVSENDRRMLKDIRIATPPRNNSLWSII